MLNFTRKVSMRPLPILASGMLVGCASSQATPTAEPMPVETVRVTTMGAGSMGIRTTPFQDSFTATALFPIAQVWAALPAAYDSVGLKLSTLQPATYTIGNEGMNIRRVLAKTPLSRYIDCGKTQIDHNADTYEVNLAMLTRLAIDASGGTKITTTLTAAAKPVAFSGDYVRCTSWEKLETRLHDVLYGMLSKKGTQ